MSNDTIRQRIITADGEFPISKITLFGPRASETNRNDSDVDLMVEFSIPVSLIGD